LNERFFEKAGLIEVASDDLYQKHPHAILETFLLYQATPGVKGLSARTLACAVQRAMPS
jgi:[protein-PII] uridylyltransferase